MIRERLQRALDLTGEGFTLDDVADAVEAGEKQLFIEPGGVVITEVIEYPAGPVLNIWLAAGRMEDCLRAHDRAIEWAREQGIEKAITTARKGWKRVMAKRGWTAPLVYLEKDLG